MGSKSFSEVETQAVENFLKPRATKFDVRESILACPYCPNDLDLFVVRICRNPHTRAR